MNGLTADGRIAQGKSILSAKLKKKIAESKDEAYVDILKKRLMVSHYGSTQPKVHLLIGFILFFSYDLVSIYWEGGIIFLKGGVIQA